MNRNAALAAGVALALAGLLLGLAAVFAPHVELNPFQASPESPTVNYVTAVALVLVGAFCLGYAGPARRGA